MASHRERDTSGPNPPTYASIRSGTEGGNTVMGRIPATCQLESPLAGDLQVHTVKGVEEIVGSQLQFRFAGFIIVHRIL